MFGLGGKKDNNPEEYAEIPENEPLPEEEARGVTDFQQQQGPRASDNVEYNMAVLLPQLIENSTFHQYIVKDLAVTQLNREDVSIIQQELSIITDLISFEIPTAAKFYHAEMIGRTTALRSVGGFERRQQNTVRSVIDRNQQNPPKSGFLNRG